MLRSLSLSLNQHTTRTTTTKQKRPNAEFDAVMHTNLYSAFNVLRPAVKAMMKQSPGGGSVVFCSSAVARHGIPNHEAIAAAKAGVNGELFVCVVFYFVCVVGWWCGEGDKACVVA